MGVPVLAGQELWPCWEQEILCYRSHFAKQCFGWGHCIRPLERHPKCFFLEMKKFEIANKDNTVVPLFWQGSSLIITVSPLHIPCAILITKACMCVPLEFMGRCSVMIHVCHTDSQNKVNFSGRAEGCALRFFKSEIPYTGKMLCPHVPPSGKDLWMLWDHSKALCFLRHLYQLNHIKWRCGFYSNTLLSWWVIQASVKFHKK